MTPVDEAASDDTPHGRYITSEGWFVLNLDEAFAVKNEERGGATFPLESREVRFQDFGANVQVLWPGEPNCYYHSESGQEGFLILSGECILVIEEQERRLRQWDYVHCPPGTRHVFVGAGNGPCAILMIGARHEDERIHYPISAVAAKYDGSSAKDTESPQEAYADWPGDFVPTRIPWPVE